MEIIKKGIKISTIFIILILVNCTNISHNKYSNIASNGILDLSRWDFESDGNIKLDGEWAFYWDKLITPEQFSAPNEPTGYYYIPEYWTKHNGLTLPSKGCATYRLSVITNNSTNYYGIIAPELYTEYCLWVNGELIASNGSFANKLVAYLNPDAYIFNSKSNKLDIVLQIKNVNHIYAGIGQSFELGTAHKIIQQRNYRTSVDILLIAICLSASIYHFVLYLFRKKDKRLIFFCMLCIAVSLRALLANEILLVQLFKNMPFIVGSKIVTLTIPACVISAALYIKALYDDDINKIVLNIIIFSNAIYAIFVLIVSSYIYSSIFVFYLYIVGVSCAYGLYVSLKVFIKKREEANYFLIGIIFLVIGAFTDIFNFLQLVRTGYVLSAGLCAFVAMQAILLAKKYSDAYNSVEKMTESLQLSLDKVLNTETAFLNVQMKPHFLYNTLNVIAECCKTDADKAEELILSLAKYLRGTLDFENLSGLIPIKKELELVKAYASIQKARFDNIEIIYDIDESLININIPPLTLQPLLENAIKHGLRSRANGGTAKIKIARQDISVMLSVQDNGIGIDDYHLKTIAGFRSEGASVGLYNINTRLIRLYKSGISIQSKVDEGTVVSFVIPLKEDKNNNV